ncbi:MAG: hypothetical protein ACJ8F7_17330 [Gemmataceae bacterium]
MYRRLFFLAIVGLVAVLPSGRADQPPASPEGVEVLARGPVHEAYAEPVNRQPEPTPVIAKQPPDPIDEIPPDEKPEGENVQWIPGYWAWDDDQNDYLWVSGFWRVPPPGRTWVSGHWQEVEGGWQWVAGLWASTETTELQYLPPPPPAIEEAASTPAPDADSTWVSGCWVYRETRYYWRPGHWVAYHPGWVWSPASYVYTPSGYLFVDGFWDYPLDERGLLFAPVRFVGEVRRYVPSVVVNTDFLLGALFVQPRYHHYFFGDYFEDRYAQRGFVAWPEYHLGKVGVDPNFAYYRQLHRADTTWTASLQQLYQARRAGEVPRPPHTLRQQAEVINNITVNKTENKVVNNNINLTHIQNVTALTPLQQVKNVRVTNLAGLSGKAPAAPPAPARQLNMQRLPADEHARQLQAAEQTRAAAAQRHEAEAKMLQEGHVPVQHADPARTLKFTPRAEPRGVAEPRTTSPAAAPPRQTPRPETAPPRNNPPPRTTPPPAVPPRTTTPPAAAPPRTTTPPAATPPRPPARQVPPPPVIPKHEERPIPHYEPPKPPAAPPQRPPVPKEKEKEKGKTGGI